MKQFLLTSLATSALALLVASATDPARWCSALLLGFGVFLFLPAVMAAAMLAVGLPLSAFVLLVGLLFAWDRPSGAPELVAEILALPLAVVPGYVAALRRVRSPRVWGFVAGCFAAMSGLVFTLTAP